MKPESLRVLTIGCAGILLAFSSCSPGKRSAAREDIDYVLGTGGVVTKVEKMPQGGTRLGEAIGVIDAPRERVWKVISDYNEQKHFMPNMLESFAFRPEALELIKGARPEDLPSLESQLRQYKSDKVAGNVVYLYSMGDFPWPMPDRRYILKVVRDAEHYTTHATMVIGQMRVNESFWELKPYGADGSKTIAKYRVLLDTGMPLPGFAVNMATNTTLPKVIEAVRDRVKDPKYGHPAKEETGSDSRHAECTQGER